MFLEVTGPSFRSSPHFSKIAWIYALGFHLLIYCVFSIEHSLPLNEEVILPPAYVSAELTPSTSIKQTPSYEEPSLFFNDTSLEELETMLHHLQEERWLGAQPYKILDMEDFL